MAKTIAAGLILVLLVWALMYWLFGMPLWQGLLFGLLGAVGAIGFARIRQRKV